MTRALLYARFSSDLQNPSSITDQLRLCCEEAKRRGWTVAGQFEDAAISATSMATRPGLLSLLQALREGRGEIVLVEALDRLSRDQADTALIFREASFHGARIVTLADGEITLMHVGLAGTMNALFVQELARKTRRGLRGRVEAGASAGGRCYGYRPGAQPGALEIDADEAEVVRRIFDAYLAGDSARTIAQALNADGVPGPRGGAWRASTITGQRSAGNGVLRNPLYDGRRVWNRRQKVTDPATGRKRMRPKAESEHVETAVPELRIVPAGTFEKVQAALEARGTASGGARKRPTRLLSGLLRCGACGGPMIIASPGRYGCATHRDKPGRDCTNNATIKAEAVETRVLDALAEALADPEAVRAAVAEYHAERQRQEVARRRQRVDLQKEVEALERKVQRTVDVVLEAGSFSDALKARLAEQEAQLKAAKAALAQAEADEPPMALHPKAAARYADLLGKLGEILKRPDAGEARELVRGLVERITLTPTGARAGYAIGIKGNLALQKEGEAMFEMGAGVGFEPTTFRL